MSSVINPLLETESPDTAPAYSLALPETFHPCRGLTNGHLQTIVGNYLPRPAFTLQAESEAVLVDAADGSRVLCHCHWQPEAVRSQRLTLVLVHGLEGSSDSRYIQGIAQRGWRSGCNVVRMNMRNCGGTDALTPTLYHSGLSGDVAAVVRHFAEKFSLQRMALVGYSMGGNLVLKAAGEWGTQAPLLAVAAVCPAIDLAAGSDALHESINRFYERHFLRGLMRRYRHKTALFPGIYQGFEQPIRSLRDFDDRIVARYCGFRNADDYYHRAAAARVVDRIALPTLVLCAADDPFIRLTTETRAKLEANPAVHFIETAHGGHCAYLGRAAGNEIHWAESNLMRFLLSVAGEDHGS
ncbi:YheT family hydrolase [Telmatobacter bradus]|uniref:YheT family hydrolase n=1 Tax=Telmatobacter bradus TaxID=474953 RepID=UPI003B4383C9